MSKRSTIFVTSLFTPSSTGENFLIVPESAPAHRKAVTSTVGRADGSSRYGGSLKAPTRLVRKCLTVQPMAPPNRLLRAEERRSSGEHEKGASSPSPHRRQRRSANASRSKSSAAACCSACALPLVPRSSSAGALPLICWRRGAAARRRACRRWPPPEPQQARAAHHTHRRDHVTLESQAATSSISSEPSFRRPLRRPRGRRFGSRAIPGRGSPPLLAARCRRRTAVPRGGRCGRGPHVRRPQHAPPP